MLSATGSWRRRGSNGRFVASKPLDVQPTSVWRDFASEGSIQTHVAMRVWRLNFRIGDNLLGTAYRCRSRTDLQFFQFRHRSTAIRPHAALGVVKSSWRSRDAISTVPGAVSFNGARVRLRSQERPSP